MGCGALSHWGPWVPLAIGGVQAEITQINCPGPKCSIITQAMQSLPCGSKSNFHLFTLDW